MEKGSTSATNKRARIDSDESPESPRAKRIREDFLEILDDVDDRDSETHDLASVMKIFEEEIAIPPPVTESRAPSSESGTQPELSFLLEASDDELGLPPTPVESGKPGEESGMLSDPAGTGGFGQIWGFEDELSSYGDFGFCPERDPNGEGEVVFDGLFDYSDEAYSSATEFSDFSWRPESLPAQ